MRLRARSVAIAGAVTVVLILAALILVLRSRHASVTVRGVVLRQDPDPRKQLPIPNAEIVAAEGGRNVQAMSDTSGLFELKLLNGGWREQPVSLLVRHPGYQPLEIDLPLSGELYVTRMKPLPAPPSAPSSLHDAVTPEVVVKDVRVRYSEKSPSTVNVGSTAKTFTVPNTGNVACAGRPPCSPDGKWKAAIGGATIDAGQGQQFQNARVSCIAGPCPFTKIETGAIPSPGRTITVMVRNWSDTVTYLVEAEVTRTMPSDAIRQAYPAIYGRSMSFTLPSAAEGPSIEADLGGAEIVFPLGPALRLSWADCTLQIAADQTKLYRCELKPGYRLQ